MKSFIIAGAPRSGKSALSKRLQSHTGFSLISGDAFVSTFEGIFPQLGISHGDDHGKTGENLENFLVVYIRHLTNYSHIPFILDVFHLTPEQVVKFKLHEQYNVVFLGYPDMTPEQKLSDMRTHKTDGFDWTDERSDESLSKDAKTFIERSRITRDSALKLGLHFVDTSRNFTQVMDEAFDDLVAGYPKR